MGEMSSIVSRSPSSRNHWNEAFWMSIRLGRSRTCFRREKLLRARGATAVLLKVGTASLYGVPRITEQRCGRADVDVRVVRVGRRNGQNGGATSQSSGNRPLTASECRGGSRN